MDDIAQDLRIAQAMLDDALDHVQADDAVAFFDGLQALAIARRIAAEAGFDLRAELAHARDRLGD